MKIVGMDVGSTTVKAVVVEDDRIVWQDYQRHHTRQAEKVLEFLSRMESECGLERGRDVVLFTGSGSGLVAPLVGGDRHLGAAGSLAPHDHPSVSLRHAPLAVRRIGGALSSWLVRQGTSA